MQIKQIVVDVYKIGYFRFLLEIQPRLPSKRDRVAMSCLEGPLGVLQKFIIYNSHLCLLGYNLMLLPQPGLGISLSLSLSRGWGQL